MANEFNRQKYNRIEIISTVDASYDMATSMDARMQIGPKVILDYQMVSEMTAAANLGYCYQNEYDMSAAMTGSVSTLPSFYFSGDLEADMELNANAFRTFTQDMDASADMDGYFHVISLYSPYIDFTDAANAMTGSFRAARTYFPNGLIASSMTADFDAVQIVEDYMVFPSLQVPKYGTLVIDGPGYNVTLSGANAIAAYQGNWLDINRNFVGLDVTSQTSGRIDVTVRYQEMFL